MSTNGLMMTITALLLLAGCGSSVTTTGDAVTDPGGDAADATDVVAEPDAADAHPDSTEPGCGAGASTPCPAGFFCELPEGACDPDLTSGECVEIPEGGCYELWAPECGCDGVTYDNDCFRLQAEQHLLHRGECVSEDPCAPWLDDCAEGEICEIPIDSCWIIGVSGVCLPIRDDCGYLWDPQCGCDGETYSNECERMAALMGLDHWGECGEACEEPGDPSCPYGTFCEFPTGYCSSTGTPGECMDIPGDCPSVWAPVCGCDGVTYGNDCERQAVEVQLDHVGEC